MYNENSNVANAQKIMLNILITIHKICVKHNLTYWLEAGTLLGAVRHKGFIPWDDDCDIAMPREDYEKFLKIAQNELPSTMFLQHNAIEPEFKIPWAKVRQNGTLLIENGESGEENYHHGIFVDIFPYDTYRDKWYLQLMHWLFKFREKKKKYKKGTLKRALVQIYTNIIMYIPVHIIKLYSKYYNNRYVGKAYYKWFSFGADNEIYLITNVDDILPVKLSENCFENQDFYMPQNSIALLEANFGKTFMQLPPIHMRKTHAKTIRIDDIIYAKIDND